MGYIISQQNPGRETKTQGRKDLQEKESRATNMLSEVISYHVRSTTKLPLWDVLWTCPPT